MASDSAYLRHILEAIQKVERYTVGFTEETFRNDDLVSDATVREIEVIGEAARNISDAAKGRNRDVNWRDVSDMRNFLTHEYFRVDLRVVWRTVVDDLPKLKAEVLHLLAEQETTRAV